MRYYLLLATLLTACELILGGPPATKCDTPTFAPRCDGNSLVRCVEGIEISFNCGDSTCSADGGSCGVCGDGTIDFGEECDNGASNSNISPDACRLDCTNPKCGDSVLDTEEECDDNNVDPGDGCDSLCVDEFCGDSITNDGTEQCDDGNADNTDACPSSCELAICGDGFVRASTEECDDGNVAANDGCDGACLREIIQISAGGEHTCALLKTGDVRCWGHGGESGSGGVGSLGYGNTNNIGDNETPARAGNVNVGGAVKQVAANNNYTCALLVTGTVRCWGTNESGQLGYGNTTTIGDDELPFSAGDVDVGAPVTQIAVGGNHSCALLTTGGVRCWGLGLWGQLGYGNTDNIGDDEPPSAVGNVDVGGTVTQTSNASSYTCALLDMGRVRCWGDGLFGNLGYGNTNDIGDDETPASAGDINVGGIVTQVATGSGHTCVLLDDGNVRCWGSGGGQLGYGNTTSIGDNEDPSGAGNVNIGASVTQISINNSHTCVVLVIGNVRCWGLNDSGQLGYRNTDIIGDTELQSVAGDVSVGGPVLQISTAGRHTCALLNTGTVRCWGANRFGELGNGTTNIIGDSELPSSPGNNTAIF